MNIGENNKVSEYGINGPCDADNSLRIWAIDETEEHCFLIVE
jgi:hypothetical protein